MNTETFSKVKCPTLTLYYYKNEQEQDPVVKVSAMMDMNSQLSTPDSLKVMVPILELISKLCSCPFLNRTNSARPRRSQSDRASPGFI